MLSVEDKPHAGPLSLHTNQIGDLFKPKSGMPVISHGFRAADERNTHLSESFTQLKILPAVEPESSIEET